MNRMRRVSWAIVTVLIFAVAASAQEQKAAAPDLTLLFEKKDVMIPMRDGVRLHTEIYVSSRRAWAMHGWATISFTTARSG